MFYVEVALDARMRRNCTTPYKVRFPVAALRLSLQAASKSPTPAALLIPPFLRIIYAEREGEEKGANGFCPLCSGGEPSRAGRKERCIIRGEEEDAASWDCRRAVMQRCAVGGPVGVGSHSAVFSVGFYSWPCLAKGLFLSLFFSALALRVLVITILSFASFALVL